MRLQENSEWVEQNFGECQLGHVQRTERLKIMANNMLARPESSLPQQNIEWSDLKAAYRLCHRSEVTFDSVAECHWKKTRQNISGRYLLISDTTDLDYSGHFATTGLGMLGDGGGRGIQLHSCLVVNSFQETVEGLAGGLLHYRSRKPKNETRMQRLRRPRESEVWGNLVDRVGPPPADAQWIHIFDRGGDNFEAVCHVIQNRCDWVIRAAKMERKVLDPNGKRIPLKKAIKQGTEIGRYELTLRSRNGEAARTTQLRVSVTRVTFPRPVHSSKYVKTCGICQIETNVVIVQEVDAPRGVTPICWILLTSLPVDTFARACQVISDYECRWIIEEYHKVLKTGCSIERHALRTNARLESLIGLIAVVGIRLLQLKTYAKQEPDAKASNRVPSRWLKAMKLMRPKILLTEMTTYQFFRELAKLGGFLGRKHDGEPGWQTIWRGYQRLQNTVHALELIIK